MSEEKVQLVFVPSVHLSHIIPTIEFAKLLVRNNNHRLNVTFLIIPAFGTGLNPQHYIDSVSNSVPNIRFISLPPADLPPPDTEPGFPYLGAYIQNYQKNVKEAITQLISHSNSVHLFVDMFTICMIDVAKELGFSSYLFFTSSAASLGLLLVLPALDSQISITTATEFIDYSTVLDIPSYVNPLPSLSLPAFYSRSSSNYKWWLSTVHRYKEFKGIIVNSFAELELQAVHAFDGLIDDIPPVYLVGPLLDLKGESKKHLESNRAQEDKIMKWLDDQPESSVLFLCFGTGGVMSAEQVKEIADGLERSGERFLWSLRRPPVDDEEVVLLPDGFVERVVGRGLVCGWAPQVEVLRHKATKGFVSHCGWNSIMESVWFGVPMITWPLDAEQKQNAFQLVKDLGVAVEIREGYHRKEGNEVVVADEVERAVKGFLKSASSDVKKKMKEMSVKCRKAVMEEGGSSFSTLKCLVDELTKQL